MDSITKVLFEVEPIVYAYEIAANNHREIHDKLAENNAKLEEILNRTMSPNYFLFDCVIAAAQKLTNFLSSTSAFLDHTETLISRTYGDKSSEILAWNHERNTLHSKKFSYRFLYELRNFSQHINIPLSSMNVTGKRGSQDDPLIFETTLLVLRDKLLAESFNWKSVRPEIESQSKQFDLLPLVDDHFESMQQLCLAAIQLQSSRLQECVRYLETWIRLLKLPVDAIPVIFVGESKSPDNPPSDMEYIPVTQLTRIQKIYKSLSTQHVN